MIEREKLLDKLRKLFALGASSNQHEAELAMAKATELMRQHQISATEVDLKEAGQMSEEDIVVGKGDGVRHFVYVMARAAATMFDGEVAALQNDRRTLRFIGTKNDIEAMKMIFTHLFASWKAIVEHDLREAKRFAESPFAPRDTMRYKHGHGVGFSTAVLARAKVLQAERRASVSAKSVTGRDLVVVKGRALTDHMRGKYHTRQTNPSPGSMGGARDGAMRGLSIPLHGAVEQREARLLGRRT